MKKSLFTVLISIILLFTISMTVLAETAAVKPIEEEPMYESFTYTVSEGKTYMLNSPAPYRTAGKITSETLGIQLSSPADIYTTDEGVYIADKVENCIIYTDFDFRIKKIFTGFENEDKIENFSAPEGVCAKEGKIYIADSGNKRVVILDQNGKLLKIIERWESTLLSESLDFVPKKIDVDQDGRIYVVVKGVYEGIMEFYDDGTFGGFIGSIPVNPDPLTALWKKFLSKEQADKLERFVPVEYTNLCVDNDGFIYTVSLMAESQDNIRRLNAAGEDILIRDSLGDIPNSGVIDCENGNAEISLDNKNNTASNFVDIYAEDDGTYYALDGKYSRIFTYDSRGNMLFSFSGVNCGRNGTFVQPSALAVIGDILCVSDSETGEITLFEKTDYANAVFNAKELYYNDKYKESIEEWNRVLQYNSSFMLAYDMIGKAEYQLKNYTSAMNYFKTATDQDGYSKAFERWRDNLYSEYFIWIIISIIAVVVVIFLVGSYVKKTKKHTPVVKRKILEDIKYLFYVIFHPFDGFWDLKYERRGRIWVSTIMIVLTIIVMTVEQSLTGFAVTGSPNYVVDIIHQIEFILVPLVLFLVGNMSITTLMDGKGTFKQLYIASGYVLTPLVITKLPLVLFSNLLTQSEGIYVTLINVIAIIWMVMLIFAALSCTHEYTAGKTVATLILTFIAMVIICFICVLFFSLFSELVGFIYSLFQEMQFR